MRSAFYLLRMLAEPQVRPKRSALIEARRQCSANANRDARHPAATAHSQLKRAFHAAVCTRSQFVCTHRTQFELARAEFHSARVVFSDQRRLAISGPFVKISLSK